MVIPFGNFTDKDAWIYDSSVIGTPATPLDAMTKDIFIFSNGLRLVPDFAARSISRGDTFADPSLLHEAIVCFVCSAGITEPVASSIRTSISKCKGNELTTEPRSCT